MQSSLLCAACNHGFQIRLINVNHEFRTENCTSSGITEKEDPLFSDATKLTRLFHNGWFQKLFNKDCCWTKFVFLLAIIVKKTIGFDVIDVVIVDVENKHVNLWATSSPLHKIFLFWIQQQIFWVWIWDLYRSEIFNLRIWDLHLVLHLQSKLYLHQGLSMF